jgi:hypothetical protein
MLGGVALNPDSAIPRYQSVRSKVQTKPRINGGDQLVGDLERFGRILREQSLDLDFNDACWSLPAQANETASDVTPALGPFLFTATNPTMTCRRF